MKFNVKLDKETAKEVGKAGLKIGKAIIVEGTKAVALKGATAAITASFEKKGGVKELTLDDVLGNTEKKNKKDKKKRLFSRKKKDEVETKVEVIKDDEEVGLSEITEADSVVVEKGEDKVVIDLVKETKED